MTILYLLIPLGLILLGIAIGAFFWATRAGQFDDLESPAWSVILDDDRMPKGGAQNRATGQTPDREVQD